MDSKTYWKNRETANLKSNLKIEAEYAKEIENIYSYMMDQITKEINGFYAKYASAEGITMEEAKKKVSKLDIEEYERKAAKYVKDKTFTSEANEEMRLYNATMKINRLELLKANIGLEMVDGFNDLQQYFDQVLTERTLSEFERQAGILGNTIQNNAKMAESIVNASFKNARFSDRIWMYQDMLKAELSKLLQEGLIQGRNPKQLATHLEKVFGVSQYNAERLMRTELARVQTDAQKQSFIANGFDEYQFNALGTVCEICAAIDGKHFKVKDMMPGTNTPPMHPNCRCSTSAYMDDDEYNEWLNTYQNHGLSFEDWQSEKNVANNNSSDIIEADDAKEVSDVYSVGKIDKSIYSCITDDIVTDEVIITDERIQHIKDRHPNDYERYYSYLRTIVEQPDYIVETNKPKTALILKEITEGKNEQFKTVLRLTTSTDNPDYKNSIITFMKINNKEWNRLIRNKTILYKKE